MYIKTRLMKKNILSIDLDIIMHPSITLYNDEVEGEDNPEELWNYFETEYHYSENHSLQYDTYTLIEIIKLSH